MPNQINVLFGPSLPVGANVVPISFVSGIKATPNESIAYLSVERYVAQNYSTLYTYSFQPSGNVVGAATIEADYDGTTVNGTTSNMLSFHLPQGLASVSNGNILFKSIHSPILLKGIVEGRTGAFYPVIKNGVVWRFYRVTSNEPEWSWLKKAGLEVNDEVFLIYTVPETRYGTEYSKHTGDNFFNDYVRFKKKTESVAIASPTSVRYSGDLIYIYEITVNGTSKFSGTFSNGDDSTYVRSIDFKSKTIYLKEGLSPDDRILVSYGEYNQNYTYRGFTYQDLAGARCHYPLDLNPEYGHYIGDPKDDKWKPSSLALLDQVLIYLIPSAFVKISFSQTASSVFEGTFTFDSAFNYGETHFVRHYVGATTETFDPDLGVLPDSWYNFWGRVPFGHRSYDEVGSESLTDDIFSEFLPSLMPLGRVILAGSHSFRSLSLADVRVRGGGVPEEFSTLGLNQQSDGLSQLRGHFDLGTWDGSVQQPGGSVIVNIDKTILDDFTREEVSEIVNFKMPPGVFADIRFVEY